jgi:HSP20 family protein
MNIGVTPDHVEVFFFAPGLDPKSIDVSVQQNVLTVAGERAAPARGDTTWYRKERFDGAFRRVINLPEDVSSDRIRARYRDGVLYVTAERPESAKPRKIEIN